MLIVQKFHSIHEIDPEFIPSLETLLEEDMVNFNHLVRLHDQSPSSYFFTYFLFFGPTQNSPIGLAQVCLKLIPSKNYLPWFSALKFWNKDHKHWKQATWEIAEGQSGLCVFDQKYSRSGKEKVQQILDEYVNRDDIQAFELYCLKGQQEFNFKNFTNNSLKELFTLAPFSKKVQTYQDYLENLSQDVRNSIKESWSELHKKFKVQLGDSDLDQNFSSKLPVDEKIFQGWIQDKAQILTFEKDQKILGCIIVLKGKNGNIFFEPVPFEPQSESIVSDVIYIQYALIKFFDISGAKKFHLLKSGMKIILEEKKDLDFFHTQGFESRTILKKFTSKLENMITPI